MIPVDDSHFRSFASTLERAIEQYGDLSEETLLDRQKRQMESLDSMEIEFRQILINHPWGPGVFRGFVEYICDERKNILAARPYFRERQTVFTEEISRALKAREDKTLYKFHFNFQFVSFAVHQCKWPKGSPIVKLAQKISDLRIELVEMNMPLAISRARIFWSRTPKSQLSYMDLVQIACEGLLSAIDKYVLPFKPVFRAVAIGRMHGNFIEQYSETQVHFFPVDKRKIYRANKLMSRFGGEHVDYEALAEEVNKDADEAHKTTAAEIADLLAAASCVSTDSAQPVGDSDLDNAPSVNRFAAPASCQPDVQFEQHEVLSRLEEAIRKLPAIEQKLLQMHGVSLGSL